MKPPSFEYLVARTGAEALSTLAQVGEGARVLAGGQSLVPLLNFRLARPEVLVDINRVSELDYIRAWDGGLAIGALTRQAVLESSPEIRARFPILADASHLIGHLPIRHRGTLGGNLAHADPASELPAVMLALDAQLSLARQTDRRIVNVSDFFTGVFQTALRPGELLTEVLLPRVAPRTGGAFIEVARRSGDFALVGVAAVLSLNAVGRCERARIALCGVGPTPIRAQQAEELLLGELPSGDVASEAANRAAEATDPPSDMHASAAFRRKLARHTVRQAIQLAAERAGGA